MKGIETFISKNLTPNIFLLGCVFVLSIPVFANFRFLLEGHYVMGQVVELSFGDSEKSHRNFSIIEYEAGGKTYTFNTPSGFLFDMHEQVGIIYLPIQPSEAALSSPIYFYLGSSLWVVLSLISLIFWLSAFFTLGIRY